jgi:hypothetical protein
MNRSHRRPLLLAALALAACSSSSNNNEPDKTAPFVGNWTVTTGTLTAMCAAPPPLNMVNQKLDGGQQVITKAADGSLTITILPGCNVILDVNGTVATLRMTTPPQSCTLMFNGLPVLGTFSSGTFTVTGETASFAYSGTGSLGTIMCPVSAMGMSMKTPPPADGGSAPPDGGSSDGP